MCAMMAKRTVLVDDVDGSEASETIEFSIDGVSYTIDLNEKNAAKLRSQMEKWISVADEVPHLPPPQRRVKKSVSDRAASAGERALIRHWASQNGYAVSDRGRIASHVEDAYRQATGG